MGTDISQLKAQHQQFITKKVDLENQKTNKDASLQDATTKSANAASQVDAANANLETSKSNLANAQSELSSFQVVEAPDKASYTITETDENGNEIENFDSDAFEAAQKAHEESVQKKQELENNVKTAETEVQTSESNVSEAEQSKTAADNEVTTITGESDQISTEISATDAKISEIETQIQEYEDGSYSISGSDKNGSITTNYDKDGNITSKTETDKDGNEIYKEYDKNGKEISSKTVYKDGKEVYKEYDENGETYKATYKKDGSQVYERFDENGNAKEKIFVNDKNMQIQVFDENGKLKEIRDIDEQNQVKTVSIDKNGKQTVTNIQPGEKDAERIRDSIKEDFVDNIANPKEITHKQTARDLAKEMLWQEFDRMGSGALTSDEANKILDEIVAELPDDQKKQAKTYLFLEDNRNAHKDEVEKLLSKHLDKREEQIRMYNNGNNVFEKGDTALMPVTQEELKIEGGKDFLKQVAESATNNYSRVETSNAFANATGITGMGQYFGDYIEKDKGEIIKNIQYAAEKGDFNKVASNLDKFSHDQNVSTKDLANIYDRLYKNPNDETALKQLSKITGEDWTKKYENATVTDAIATKYVSDIVLDSFDFSTGNVSSGIKIGGRIGKYAKRAEKLKESYDRVKVGNDVANSSTLKEAFNVASDAFLPYARTVQNILGTNDDDIDYNKFKKQYKK